jgi:hypothetical protein
MVALKKIKNKKLRRQLHEKFSDISSADGNKYPNITIQPYFKKLKRQYI